MINCLMQMKEAVALRKNLILELDRLGKQLDALIEWEDDCEAVDVVVFVPDFKI